MSVSDSQRDLISVQVNSPSCDEDANDVDVEDVDDDDDDVAQVSGSPGGGLGGALSKMGTDGNRKLWGGLVCRSVTTILTFKQVSKNFEARLSLEKAFWKNFASQLNHFSLLLSLGLIVALVVVSNRTPAGHVVRKT